jgi:hypothetical protein
MGPIGFVLAIMGCADGATDCRVVQTMPTVYASRAQCAAATTAALESMTHLDFPTISAECRAAPRSGAGGLRR